MTTAHRPTFFNALGGEQQGGNLIVAQTTKVSVRDLPGHSVLKTRQVRPPPLYSDDVAGATQAIPSLKSQFKENLIKKEKEHQAQKQIEAVVANQPLEAVHHTFPPPQKIQKLEKEPNPFPEDEDDHGPLKLEAQKQKSRAENSDVSDSDDEDDEEQQLLMELEKIKREREQEQQRIERQEQQRQQRLQALTSNALLMEEGNKALKRRWDDDVIFKNQAKNLAKPKKRFINDTLRSDFHRKFLAKYIL